MPWTLSTHDVELFERNTLAVVIVQLRFQPILKIAERVSDFQERLRPRFPGYQLEEGQTFEFGPLGPLLRNEATHRFRANDEPAVASLTPSALTIEYTAHKDRSILLGDIRTSLDALQAFYTPISPVRLGIRYVNLIDRDRIAVDLKRPVSWSELLTEAFAAVPGNVATFDESTNFLVEVTSACERGGMTVRYGLLRQPPPRNVQQFRLDTDRYIEAGFTMDEVGNLLDRFSADIFQVFRTFAGGALLEWMGRRGGG